MAAFTEEDIVRIRANFNNLYNAIFAPLDSETVKRNKVEFIYLNPRGRSKSNKPSSRASIKAVYEALKTNEVEAFQRYGQIYSSEPFLRRNLGPDTTHIRRSDYEQSRRHRERTGYGRSGSVSSALDARPRRSSAMHDDDDQFSMNRRTRTRHNHVESGSEVSVVDRGHGYQKTSLWTHREEKLFDRGVKKYGTRKWHKVAKYVQTRTRDECMALWRRRCEAEDQRCTTTEESDLQEDSDNGSNYAGRNQRRIRSFTDNNTAVDIEFNENGRRMRPGGVRDIWSTDDKKLYARVLAECGKDWEVLMDAFSSKTYSQIRNFFNNNRKDLQPLVDKYNAGQRAMQTGAQDIDQLSVLEESPPPAVPVPRKREREDAMVEERKKVEMEAGDKESLQIPPEDQKGKSGSGRTILWTEDDRAKYIEQVKLHGYDYASIQNGFPNHTLQQVKNFFNNNRRKLNLNQIADQVEAKRGESISQQRGVATLWTAEDKARFADAVRKCGKNWEALAQMFPGKTSSQTRNFFNNHRHKMGLDQLVKEFCEGKSTPPRSVAGIQSRTPASILVTDLSDTDKQTPSGPTQVWTKEYREKFKELVPKYGKVFEKYVMYFPDISKAQIRNFYYNNRLQFEPLLPSATSSLTPVEKTAKDLIHGSGVQPSPLDDPDATRRPRKRPKPSLEGVDPSTSSPLESRPNETQKRALGTQGVFSDEDDESDNGDNDLDHHANINYHRSRGWRLPQGENPDNFMEETDDENAGDSDAANMESTRKRNRRRTPRTNDTSHTVPANDTAMFETPLNAKGTTNEDASARTDLDAINLDDGATLDDLNEIIASMGGDAPKGMARELMHLKPLMGTPPKIAKPANSKRGTRRTRHTNGPTENQDSTPDQDAIESANKTPLRQSTRRAVMKPLGDSNSANMPMA
eukprot:Clim_evm111s149 gene=Clim_evmTU111s149